MSQSTAKTRGTGRICELTNVYIDTCKLVVANGRFMGNKSRLKMTKTGSARTGTTVVE